MEPATASMIGYLGTFARVGVHTYITCMYIYIRIWGAKRCEVIKNQRLNALISAKA